MAATAHEFLSQNLSFWNALTDQQKQQAEASAYKTVYEKGRSVTNGFKQCLGLVCIASGQLRAYITSNEGREITLYRLLEQDVCILSASCMLKNMNFEIQIDAEKDSTLYIIPISCFHKLSEENPALNQYSLELVSARFSEVMWVFEQYVFGSAAGRLAGFLLAQSALENSEVLGITHEFIANDLGTAREVITRLLKHFSGDGLVSLSRGKITILDSHKLRQLSR